MGTVIRTKLPKKYNIRSHWGNRLSDLIKRVDLITQRVLLDGELHLYHQTKDVIQHNQAAIEEVLVAFEKDLEEIEGRIADEQL